MPAIFLHAGLTRRMLPTVGCLCALLFLALAFAKPTHPPASHTPFEKAQSMREALEGRAEKQRTRRDYERVMDAYRAVYHGDPRSGRADDAVSTVADLLAEEGRLFEDDKSLHDAIGQYDFLRKQYPASGLRFSALLTIGEIYLRDLNDRDNARATFQQFLKLYPQNPLADSARSELASLKKSGGREKHPASLAAQSVTAPETSPSTSRDHHRTVLDAARDSQPSESTAAKPSVASTPVQTRTESDIPPAATAQEPQPEPSRLSEAALNATPPPRHGKLPLVTGVRHWSTSVYTRVAIDLQDQVGYEATRVTGPDRIFFDLHGTHLSPELIGKSDEVINDGFLKRIRVAQFSNDVTRVVLDVSDVSEYSAFFLPNPYRLIIDVHGSKSRPHTTAVANNAEPAPLPNPAQPVLAPARKTQQSASTGNPTSTVKELGAPLPKATSQPETLAGKTGTKTTARSTRQPHTGSAASDAERPAASDPTALSDVATLSQQPNRVKATRHPTTAPVAQSVAGTTQAPQANELASVTPPPVPPATITRSSRPANSTDAVMPEIRAAEPTADGQRSMVRALGLKINRIVVDAGHGGHDSGTLGPGGIEEKDVVLDVALRLGKLLKDRLGADVTYTRDDDTFIPLETRTAIANKAQADLFVSVHANSSSDPSARGVETYYLNFTTSADALEVAARENAVSDQSIHQLSDLVRKITLQDKINESRELASDVEQSLYTGLEDGNPGLKNRGVKKAPFVVLIGANMPSILAEISFLTNPSDASQLRESAYRQRIAESLYHGVARYVSSLNGTRLADTSRSSR